MDGWVDGWTDGWTGGWTGGWMDGWMDGWTDGWVDGWMDGWMGGWMDGWMDGWINSMGSIHRVEYDSAMKRSEALTQVTMWMDLEHMMLSEGSLTQKDTQYAIPLRGNVRNTQTHRHRRQIKG